MGPVGWIAFVLVIIGGLNWGLVAISANYDLVAMIFGAGTTLARIVYGLVGIAALVMLIGAFMKKGSSAPQM